MARLLQKIRWPHLVLGTLVGRAEHRPRHSAKAMKISYGGDMEWQIADAVREELEDK